MVLIYPVIFTATHDKKDTYLVEIPDLKGMTEGYGLEDAYNMARDYIGNTFYDKDDSEVIKASKISDIDIQSSQFFSGDDSFVSLVDLDLTAFRRSLNKKSVRRNVSIPMWLNQAADEAHLNVSHILQEALKEKLGVKE